LTTRLSPWDQIERYWKHTSHIRLNKLRSTSNSDDTLKSITSQKDKDTEKEQYHTLKVYNYFNTYKCLKQPLGYTLVSFYLL